jgi:phosphoribosylamine--glycine ligase
MNILLIGGGGREHALAWKLAESPSLGKAGGRLYAAPGNPGIAQHAEIIALDIGDHEAVANFARRAEIGLVVVGPEAPLVAGLADRLTEAGVAVFGPSAAAARLEGSKAFTKALCDRAQIPTARYVRAADADAARAALAGFALPVVVKADGLAAGKGVVIAHTREEAEHAVAGMFEGAFGAAGAEIVIEEHLTGEEASYFALTDGRTILPFGSAQDHKRVGDGDTGPNTGGMGAYSPAPVLTPELEKTVLDRIIRPTVEILAQDGTPYVGVLYAGLMLTAEGPKLIEYNCRFGDPECQVLMMRYEGDLAALMLAAAQGRLAEAEGGQFRPDYALTVVMAAPGYPGNPEKGGAISGIARAEATGARIFHAGTRLRDGKLVADGGRVLNVTATGESVTEAGKAAYRAVDAVDFPSGFCRRDIGWREAGRETN